MALHQTFSVTDYGGRGGSIADDLDIYLWIFLIFLFGILEIKEGN